MDKKETAVNWLELKIKEILEKNDIIIEDAIWDMAKNMEREQINHAWNDGYLEGIDGGVTAVAKEYINRIFGGQDER
jgi:hypothetical protein